MPLSICDKKGTGNLGERHSGDMEKLVLLPRTQGGVLGRRGTMDSVPSSHVDCAQNSMTTDPNPSQREV